MTTSTKTIFIMIVMLFAAAHSKKTFLRTKCYADMMDRNRITLKTCKEIVCGAPWANNGQDCCMNSDNPTSEGQFCTKYSCPKTGRWIYAGPNWLSTC